MRPSRLGRRPRGSGWPGRWLRQERALLAIAEVPGEAGPRSTHRGLRIASPNPLHSARPGPSPRPCSSSPAAPASSARTWSHALNGLGHDDILVVDDLTDGQKFRNLATARIADYLDRDDFRRRIADGADFGRGRGRLPSGRLHRHHRVGRAHHARHQFRLLQGALRLVPGARRAAGLCLVGGGLRRGRRIQRGHGGPASAQRLWLVEAALRPVGGAPKGRPQARVVGLRYFNVYGPGEAHKGRMASVVHHFSKQIEETGVVKVFAASHGYRRRRAPARFRFCRRRREGQCVGAAIRTEANGLYNVGTGASRTFNDIARRGDRLPRPGADRIHPLSRRLARPPISRSPRPISGGCGRRATRTPSCRLTTGCRKPSVPTRRVPEAQDGSAAARTASMTS